MNQTHSWGPEHGSPVAHNRRFRKFMFEWELTSQLSVHQIFTCVRRLWKSSMAKADGGVLWIGLCETLGLNQSRNISKQIRNHGSAISRMFQMHISRLDIVFFFHIVTWCIGPTRWWKYNRAIVCITIHLTPQINTTWQIQQEVAITWSTFVCGSKSERHMFSRNENSDKPSC